MRESLALRGNEFTKKEFRGKGVSLIPVRNIQLWFRSACNRREVSQESFTGFWPGSEGRFPGRGSSVSGHGGLQVTPERCTDKLKRGALFMLDPHPPNSLVQ